MTATALTTSPAPTAVFAVTRGALRQLGRQPPVWVGGGILLADPAAGRVRALGGAA